MHDDMQYDPIQGQGHKPLKSEIWPFSTAIASPIYNGAGKWPRILKLFCPSFCVTLLWNWQ